MATQRREQVVRLAEALEVEFDRSMATLELMEICITEAEARREGAREAENEGEVEPAPESATEHRAGGNGARQLERSRRRFESEREQVEALATVERPVEAPEAAEVAPALSYTRRERRRGGRRAAEASV